jgi:lipid II:glycine glycyltransferase (peptidoglycan interpeptide bridge formation enzyme)
MKVEIQVATEEDSQLWDRLIDASPYGTVFHTWKWLKIMEKHSRTNLILEKLKGDLYPLVGFKGDRPIGVIPLFHFSNQFFSQVSSPPSDVEAEYLGPVLIDYDKMNQRKRESLFIQFQKKIDEFISSLKAGYISISTPPGFQDCRPFSWNSYAIKPMYNYLLDVSKGEDHLWKHFTKEARWDINKAKKKGIVIEEGRKEELKRIFDVYYNTFKSQGRRVNFSKEYLLDVYDAFSPTNLKVFVAKYQGEFVSGIIATCFRDVFSVWMGSSKPPIKDLPANDLLYWETMKWAINHECKYYEMIWANTPRLNRFKSKYNPDLSIYFSARKYNSFFAKLLRTGYIQVYKPISMKV